MKKYLQVALAMIVAVVLVAGCASGPSTKEEVCASYDQLGRQMLNGNGVFGNPLFKKAGRLGGLARRYPDTGVQSDGARLKQISHSDSTSGDVLMAATQRLATLCGAPLGMKAMFGNG